MRALPAKLANGPYMTENTSDSRYTAPDSNKRKDHPDIVYFRYSIFIVSLLNIYVDISQRSESFVGLGS